ncbi:phosphotransferase enzyme family protein [Paenibacillus kobensis]|uniref:phosphotransferase enzyme family protein n=1 Tax=Paenibacillus kobensis TaxID=59841 RepID=UPI000FD77A51|nr:phosphotransferase [Paenibacillus kobensis]
MDKTLIIEASKLYGIAKEECNFIGGFQNLVYSYAKDNKNYVLRFSHDSHRSDTLILAELDWINHLADNGLSVCKSIQSIRQVDCEMVETNNDRYYVVAFEMAKGKKININHESEWNEEFFGRWGSTVGRIHSLTKKYKSKQVAARRPHQYDKDQEFIHTISKKLEDTQTFSLQKFIYLSEALKPDKKEEHDLYGLVHNDIHMGNFHVVGKELQLFDFDECSYNWFGNDIAMPLFYSVWESTLNNIERTEFAKKFIHYFLNGYSKEVSITDDTLKHIPSLLKMREVVLHLFFNTRWNLSELTFKQQKTLKDLEFKIKNDIPVLERIF